MKKVIIIGGGIAGLTCAHELSNYDYDITIIERNNIVGGLARTYQDEKNKICPIEYSWRAYGKWYQNVFHIMKQIPFENETVYEQLIILEGGDKTCDKKIPNYNSLNTIELKDKLILLPYFLKYMASCKDRNIENFSHIGLRNFIQNLNLSKNTEDKIGKIVGPYLGFDYQHASLYDLFYTVEMMRINSNDKYNFSISKYPTNYSWLDPWVKYLNNKGVKILTDIHVEQFVIKNNKIEKILVNKDTFITADYFINCTGPEVLETLLRPYKNSYNDYYKLVNNSKIYGRQIQLSVYYYIDKKLFLNNKNTLAYLPNTPWLLMVLPTGHIWGDKFLKRYCKKTIREVVSVGICEPYVKGNLIKKPWSECTIQEIEIEAWNQLINDKDFSENVCVDSNVNLSDVKVLDFKLWDSYKYNGKVIDTIEPKWGNNINTAKNRPIPESPIHNLIIGGAYTNTSTGCYSMESACESGKLAAKSLCKIDNKKNDIYIHTKDTFFLTKPIREMDRMVYNEPMVFLIIIVSILIIIVILVKLN